MTVKHGTSRYSAGCRCEICAMANIEYQRRYRARRKAEGRPAHLTRVPRPPKLPKPKAEPEIRSTTTHSYGDAVDWQLQCADTYGIGVRVHEMAGAFSVEHDPENCCGSVMHTTSREGACMRHRPYGRSPFCSECEGNLWRSISTTTRLGRCRL